jgi:aldose 1-epimerase
MTIERRIVGEHAGIPVLGFTLRNRHGLVARMMTFGACLTELHVPDKAGRMADIVLGFDDLGDYVTTDTYFGATCGRYGGRIRAGRFRLDDRWVQVAQNEAPNHLHGGAVGFDKQVWAAWPDETDNSVTFSLVSSSGSQGYPGEVCVTSKYALTDDRLILTMIGITDAPTILNMVHHSYWNLAGHASGSILEHRLTMPADFYTPIDAELMPTGEILSVAGTAFDFREEKGIGRDLHAIHGAGYDHNFVLSGIHDGLRPVAQVYDPASGRGLRVRATEPGVQFYTGGYLSPRVIGKGKTPYGAFAGFTLETQKFPDAPNFAHFPSARLDPGQLYRHCMEIEFYTS